MRKRFYRIREHCFKRIGGWGSAAFIHLDEELNQLRGNVPDQPTPFRRYSWDDEPFPSKNIEGATVRPEKRIGLRYPLAKINFRQDSLQGTTELSRAVGGASKSLVGAGEWTALHRRLHRLHCLGG